jgi:DNA-binding response OmpR family regulator
MDELADCCILVVEDEFYLAKDVQHTLKRAGARIMGPYPGHEEAASALKVDRPDCAIIDVNLGGGANFDLADRLRAEGIPFVFFTGYDREVIPSRFADVTRLEKPMDTHRLVQAAKATCEAHRASART